MKRKTIIGIKDADSLGAKLAKIKIAEYFKDDRAVIDTTAKDKIVITQKHEKEELGPYFGLCECDVYDDKEVMKYVSFIHHYKNAESSEYTDCIKEFDRVEDKFKNVCQ